MLAYLDELSKDIPYTHIIHCNLLFELCCRYPECQIMEIASGYGKATLYLAAAAKKVNGFMHSVDLCGRSWNNMSAQELLLKAQLSEVSKVEFKRDARWYLLEMFTRKRGAWINVAFLDAAHCVEVDSFCALALWTHLKPGGLLIFDDIDWIPAWHAPKDELYTNPMISHVKTIFDYVGTLSDVEEKFTYFHEKVGWRWGYIQKKGYSSGEKITRETIHSIVSSIIKHEQE